MLRISGWEEPNEMNHIIKWKKNISNDFIHILIKPHIFSQYNTFQVSRDFGGLIKNDVIVEVLVLYATYIYQLFVFCMCLIVQWAMVIKYTKIL